MLGIIVFASHSARSEANPEKCFGQITQLDAHQDKCLHVFLQFSIDIGSRSRSALLLYVMQGISFLLLKLCFLSLVFYPLGGMLM